MLGKEGYKVPTEDPANRVLKAYKDYPVPLELLVIKDLLESQEKMEKLDHKVRLDQEVTLVKMAYQVRRDHLARKEMMEIVVHLVLQVQEDSRFEKYIIESVLMVIIMKYICRVSQVLQAMQAHKEKMVKMASRVHQAWSDQMVCVVNEDHLVIGVQPVYRD